MREILFRAKAKNGGEWVEGYLVPLQDGEKTSWYIYGKAEVDSETVGQYTGLTNKNGERIFEGDIVRVSGASYEVAMDGDRRGWYPFACGDGCGCCEKDVVSPYDVKIIGNIHDNPEFSEVAR